MGRTADALPVTPSTKTVLQSGDGASTEKRTGAQLWRSAAKKSHAVSVVHQLHKNHAVHHQLQHRASEKLGFGVAEHLLEALVEATIERHTLVHHHATGAKALSWLQRATAAPTKLARNVTCGLRSLGPAAMRCRAPPVPVPPSLASRTWAASLDGVKITLPCAGTALVAHMAHHDWHRAHHEWHERGRCLSTLLFVLAAAFDAADAIVHAMVVLLMLAERLCDHETLHAYHLDHLDHLEHELHHSAMVCAVCATITIVTGEVLSARASPAGAAKKHH